MADKNGASRYREVLQSYLSGAGEDSLMLAYDIGRKALENGASVLDIASAHKTAIVDILREDSDRNAIELLEAAEPFLFESLSSFEMNQQSVAEANSILRRLNHMLEDEAGRIAHALHDEAGGILASARMEFDLASRNLPDDVLERFEQVRQLLDQTGEQLRHLSHELRPMILDDLGILPALNYLASGISKRTGVEIAVHGRLESRPPPAVELAVYRAVQEALNNLVRHGGDVTEATVRIARHKSVLSCIIEDDGCGFDPDAVLADKSRTSMGLAGIRERVHAVGGALTIDSQPGEGTCLTVKIPLNDSHAGH